MDELNSESLNHRASDPIVIEETELAKFRVLFQLMTVIFTHPDQEVLYESDAFHQNFDVYGPHQVARLIANHHQNQQRAQFEFSLVHEGNRYDYGVILKEVLYQDKASMLGIVQEKARSSALASTDEKITRISKALLQIVGSVDIADDISKTLDRILSESIRIFEHSHFGTVFIVSDQGFKNISQIGFDQSIKNFSLDFRDSFLYKATDGRMDRIALIQDIRKNYVVKPLKTTTGEVFDIQSTIVAPIYYKGSLYGMMSIDSTRLDAFVPDDVAVMTFIRDNVEVIISNQLTFLERTSQALTDHMTGLYNRHFLVEHFNTILERAKRYEETFSVVVFDLDGLKAINDRYGHLVGDQLIKHFTQTLTANTRRSDILARYGGDEFVAILLTGNVPEIVKKIEGLDRHFRFVLNEKTTLDLDYDFSYGIAVYPTDGKTSTQLINVADARMYEVKSANKAKRKG